MRFLGGLLVGIALGAMPGFAAERSTTAALPKQAIVDRQSELPAPLAAADAATYRRIFAFQDRARWAEADRQIARLDDRLLVGHVLAQRYLHSHYRTPGAELADWLAKYADHPDAPRLYRLAGRRVPKSKRVRRPIGETFGGAWHADDLGPPPQRPPPAGRKLSGADRQRANAVKAQFRRALRAGRLAAAERILHTRDAERLLSDGERDHYAAQVAAGWFAQGDKAKALDLARAAAARSGKIVPRAHWIAGLSLFERNRFADAAKHFEALARTPKGEPWDIAAGAFWASRSHARDRQFAEVNKWLGVAAEHPRTFYGLLAIRQLGVPTPFDWEPPELTPREIAALQRLAAGKRAFALLQVGQSERAEAELRRIYANEGPEFTLPLLAVAMRADMPGLSIRLGRDLSEEQGRRHEGALYPTPPWIPTNGYRVDRALVFAFMRQESQFNPRAISPAGARGLMQLMPQTAAHLAGDAYRGRADLLDPVYNVTLGQRYILELLQHEAVQGDLIRLAAAYNGGPGNLMRWTKKHDADGGVEDALLFIESLPSPETRHFITRLLYSYWMYSERLGLTTPSLDDIAAGRWPTYIALDSKGSHRNAQTR